MSFILTIEVSSVQQLLHHIAEHTRGWGRERNVRPWFRGQADASRPPLPFVFRGTYDEFSMASMFRLKALAFGQTPETNRLDQWLFLGQHYGLPTRLLDWTESAVFACFFAAQWAAFETSESHHSSSHSAVWMLNPGALNRLSLVDGFPNTWTAGNVGNENFRMAFHPKEDRDTMIRDGLLRPSRYPLAVQASAVDRRVVVQRSCFTIQGIDERDFELLSLETGLAEAGHFRKFIIPRDVAPSLVDSLTDMGISFSTVYPDFTGLAMELRHGFGTKPTIGTIRNPNDSRPLGPLDQSSST